jgi:class 3 adenylate cyclase/tetratricopeptide (TPR) repeat protein
MMRQSMGTTGRVCGNCGAEAAADARFCSQCATPLSEPAAPAQERRQVTVFFSDLAGFTALNERLDPEDVRDIVNKIWERADEIVGRYEGRINKLLGDAVMAVFGDPVAHEDDPLRAVRAALELHEAVEALNREVEPRIGSPIGMHTGVNTGVVLTSEKVLDGQQTGPLGDTINVAARLQSLAETGQVLVGPETRRAIEGTFELEDLGAHDLKGKDEPVPVALVRSVALRRVTPARRQGRFVGRDRELSLLADELEHARQGSPAFVAVSGEAGSGKTRLVEEFHTRIASDATWLEGRAYAFAENIPYYAVTDLISNSMGIDEADSPEEVLTKLEEGITAIVQDSAEILPPLLQLYDLEGSEGSSIDREAYQGRLLDALRALMQALAGQGTLIVCLQDLHWADPSTVALLRQLAGELSAPALLLFNYRPEFALEQDGIREIKLDALSDRQTGDLVESLLDTNTVPKDLVRFLDDRTDGNPFFVEEIINSLIESGVLAQNGEGWALTGDFDALSVPSTIRGVIAARIDTLEVARRRILQEASVIGREFLYKILSQVSDSRGELAGGLSVLESADLIRKRAAESDPELEYLFKHALTQEVAYGGLLREERQALHHRVALAMEQLLGERQREYAESISYHFEKSDAPERAVPHLIVSGKKAVERYALEEAETHYRSAYAILTSQPESGERERELLVLILEWALLHYYTANLRLIELWMEDHADLPDRVGDPELHGMWWTWRCLISYISTSIDEAVGFADRAIAIGRECGSAKVIGYANTQKTWALFLGGRSRDATAAGEEALRQVEHLSDERDSRYVRLKAGAGTALAYAYTGDLIKSRAMIEEAIEFGNETASARAKSLALYVLGSSQNLTGDVEDSLAALQTAREAAPDPLYRCVVDMVLGGLLVQEGGARDVIEPAIRFAEEHGLAVLLVAHRANEALLMFSEGDLARGTEQLERAKEEAAERGAGIVESYAGQVEATMYARLATGEGAGKMSVGEKLSALVRNFTFIAGRGRRAGQLAREALTEMSDHLSPDVEGTRFQVELELAKLLVTRKEADEARKHLDKAIAFLQPVGDCGGMREARELLATLE